MDSKGEVMYSPTQNFNDEDFKSESEVGDDKNKLVTNKSNSRKTKSKKIKKSKRSQNKRNRKSSHSSSKSITRSNNGSKSSKSDSPASHRSSSSSKSPSSSKSSERKKRSRNRHDSRNRRRDNSRRVSSKHRRTRSREDRKHRYVNDPYKYRSPTRQSRDKRHNADLVNERQHNRGDRGRDHGRGRDDQNYWRRDRSEHYRDYTKRGEAWDHKGYDKYKESRDGEKRQSSYLRDENITGNKLVNDAQAENETTTDKNKIDEVTKSLDDGSFIIQKQHIKRLENFEIRSHNSQTFDSKPQSAFEPRLQSNFVMQQPVPFESRPPFNFESRPPLRFESRPPLSFDSKSNLSHEPRPPIQFQNNFRESRPVMDNSANLLQLRPGMPFNPNQPIIGPPNQQYRIIGPPRQQGGLVFRPVQIMEPGLDWRMDMRLPMLSQSGAIPITANSIMYRGPPVEFQRNQISRPLLPLPQHPPMQQQMQPPLQPQMQLPVQGMHQRQGGSSPPPPPPPVRFIVNHVEANNRFLQPGEYNRFSTPLGEVENRFHQSVIPPMQLELSNFNPNVPPPNIQQQFLPNPPPHHQPSSPQTPLQSEEQILNSSPSPKQNIDAKIMKGQYSPYSIDSEPPDKQYDAYQDDLFADNLKNSSNTPSPLSPNTDDQLEFSSSKKINKVLKPRTSQEDKLSTNNHEQHRLEAKIAPFSIGTQKKQSLNNPAINQVFGTVAPPAPRSLSPLPIPGLSDSVADSLEQLTSLLNSASGTKSMDFKQPDFSSLASFVASQSPLQEDLDIPMDLAANASQQTIQLARQLGLFELTKVLEQASGNAEIGNDIKDKTEITKKGKIDSANPSLDKMSRMDRIAEEVKMALKPHFAKNIITKEDYKDIMRKAVPKISGSKSDLDRSRIKAFVFEYVQKIHQAKKLAKSEQKKFHKKTL